MIKILSAALLVAFTTPMFAADGEQLFNGNNLNGWAVVDHQEGTPPSFVVKDGAIQTNPGGHGFLWYTGHKIGNATIRVVYRMSTEKGNSGVFIRIPDRPPSEDYAINHGIEVQIDNRDNDYHCTGVLYSMTKAKARPYKPAGEWNTMEITLQGPRTIVKVNGVLVTDYDGISPVPAKKQQWEPDRGPRPDSGYIGLQHHDDEAVISFKEISVHPLNRQ